MKKFIVLHLITGGYSETVGTYHPISKNPDYRVNTKFNQNFDSEARVYSPIPNDVLFDTEDEALAFAANIKTKGGGTYCVVPVIVVQPK